MNNDEKIEELYQRIFELEAEVHKLEIVNSYLKKDLIKAMNIINNEILKGDSSNEC